MTLFPGNIYLYSQHAGVFGVILVISFLFLSLILDKPLSSIMLRICKGKEKLATIVLAFIVFFISAFFSAALTSFLEAII